MSAQLRDFSGATAVVTGAGRGFGRAVAIALAGRGCDVVLASRNAAELGETAALAEGAPGRTLVVPTDVSRPEEVDALKEASTNAFGMVGILVNNAAVHGPVSAIAATDAEDWLRTLAINTGGPLLTCRAFVPGMVETGWGRVINVSSSSCFMEPDAVSSAYTTSKVALNQLTRHLAAELDGTGVTANAIHPGSLRTEMWRDIRTKAEGVPNAERLTEWTDRVDANGGDPTEKGVEVVMKLIDDDGTTNGQFCWPENAMETPAVTW